MSRVIDEASKRLSVDPWWVESVAIEYLDCRQLCVGETLWRFDFDRLSIDELVSAVEKHRIVMRGCLFHNVLPEVAIQRMMRGMVGAPSVNPGFGGDVIPEGPVSGFRFAAPDNPIDVEDPKLSPTLGRCQVWDDGRLWQWYFAKDGPDGFRNSDIIDMTAFEHVAKLREKAESARSAPGSAGYVAYQEATKLLYEVAEDVRAPIRERLLRLHSERKLTATDTAVTVDVPPRLTYFESFRIRDHEFETRFMAEPMFYRSCLTRVKKAQELSLKVRGRSGVEGLLEIYEERASAVIMAAACLEAYVNGVLRSGHEALWKSIETLSFPSKWHLSLVLHDAADLWKPGEQPIQTLRDVYSSRNELMHPKADFARVCRDGGRVRARLENTTLRESLVDQLPARLKELILQLATAVKQTPPEWLDPAPGWDMPAAFTPPRSGEEQPHGPQQRALYFRVKGEVRVSKPGDSERGASRDSTMSGEPQ